MDLHAHHAALDDEQNRDELLAAVTAAHRAAFGTPPSAAAAAPGRVNLLGEHTDYNEGFVLPAAIDRHVAVTAGRLDTDTLAVHALLYRTTATLPLGQLRPDPSHPWLNYVAGVAALLRERNIPVHGTALTIGGTVPAGAGLSSSAALELATAGVLLALSGLTLDPLEMVRLCHRAEHLFAGVECGIMDQLVSALGRMGHALFLDCRTLENRHLALPSGVEMLICHTGVERSLSASGYNTRREECRAALHACTFLQPAPAALRDLSEDALTRAAAVLTPLQFRRARHVVTENRRVLEAVDALEHGDLTGFGKLMYRSHMSLKNDFDVSTSELDALVDICAGSEGVYGARMTGAGFGGSVLCLADVRHSAGIVRRLEREYPAATGHTPRIFRCHAEDGMTRTRASAAGES